MRLEGKVAIVTGGGAGIGRASAELLAREGARVIVVDRNHQAAQDVAMAIVDAGGQATALYADVSQAADCHAMVQGAIDRYSRLDILVNNAAVHLSKDAESTSEEEWDRVLATNLKSVFLAVKYAIPALKAQRGVIINMSSMVGIVGQASSVAYSASKGGIIALTRSLALDYAHDGVRVNCVCPSAVHTPLLDEWIARQADPAQVRAAMDHMHPLGWAARPEEIAAAVVFLASDESSFITGVALPVEGGATLGYRA